MNAAPLAILTASLLGSVHCAAMCGGFVCFYADGSGPGATRNAALTSHGLYNAGRLCAYVALGLAAGALGTHVTHLGAFAGISRMAAVASGSLLVLWSVNELWSRSGSGPAAHVRRSAVPEQWQRVAGSALLHVRNQPASVRAFVTGLLTGALPCGWLYVFVVVAGGSGSALNGALTMLVFWLGTVPALVAVGVGAQRLLGPMRDRLPRLSAVVVLVTGLLTISGRLVFTHVH